MLLHDRQLATEGVSVSLGSATKGLRQNLGRSVKVFGLDNVVRQRNAKTLQCAKVSIVGFDQCHRNGFQIFASSSTDIHGKAKQVLRLSQRASATSKVGKGRSQLVIGNAVGHLQLGDEIFALFDLGICCFSRILQGKRQLLLALLILGSSLGCIVSKLSGGSASDSQTGGGNLAHLGELFAEAVGFLADLLHCASS